MTANAKQESPLWTEAQALEYLNLEPDSTYLKNKRGRRGEGPRYLIIARKVRYRQPDLDVFIEESTRGLTVVDK